MNRQAIVKQKICVIYKRLEFSTQNILNSLVNSTGKSQTIHQKSGQIYMKNVHKKNETIEICIQKRTQICWLSGKNKTKHEMSVFIHQVEKKETLKHSRIGQT